MPQKKMLDTTAWVLTDPAYHGMIRAGAWRGALAQTYGLFPVVDLGFDIHLGGRAAKALSAEVVRELTQSDLALLATERGIKPTSVQRITDRHHALARCLASGMSITESCLVTGYTPSRISVLRGDPAFEELIAFYRNDKAKTVLDYQEKLAIARNMATDGLIDRMEEKPEAFSAGDYLDIIKTSADRTGHGPKQTNVNVNVNLGDRMKAARERAATIALPGRGLGRVDSSRGASLAPTIEGEFTEVGDG